MRGASDVDMYMPARARACIERRNAFALYMVACGRARPRFEVLLLG